jgi:hypothetical protein
MNEFSSGEKEGGERQVHIFAPPDMRHGGKGSNIYI